MLQMLQLETNVIFTAYCWLGLNFFELCCGLFLRPPYQFKQVICIYALNFKLHERRLQIEMRSLNLND